MSHLNEDLLHDAVLRATRLERVENGQVRAVLAQLNEQVLAPVHLLAVESITRQAANALQPQKMRELLTELRAFTSPAYRDLYATMRDQLIPVGVSEVRWSRNNIDSHLSRIGIVWDTKSPAMHQVRAVVTSDPFEGRLLREWSRALEQTLLTDIRDQLVIGLAQGDSATQLERRLTGLARQRGVGGVYGKQRRAARSVARTAFIHTSSTARELLYKANEDLIKGTQWVATLDSRTCPECGLLDGQVFDPGAGPRPPAHHQCRCTTVPVLRSFRELGFQVRDLPEDTRASMNGSVSAKLKFPDWLRTQSSGIQDEVLGVAKARLWRSGALDFKDFVGNAGRILSLDELDFL